MRFIDKKIIIYNKLIDILFTLTPKMWKYTSFKWRKTIINYPGKMLNICLLGFQFRLIIGKKE